MHLASRSIAACLLLGMCAAAFAHTAANGQPVAQPDLAAAVEAAPELKFEELADGPDACWEGPMWWVPNPDGKTWDFVFIYSRSYQGPHEVFAFDTATKELKKFDVPPGNNFHIVPYLIIGGKLLIKPGIGAKDVSLWTYDPATNELAFGGYPIGQNAVAGDGQFAPNDRVKMWWRYNDSAVAAAAHVEPGAWQAIDLPPVTFYPSPVRRLTALPDGTLFTLSEGYARAITFNPRTGERKTLGPTMSVYSVVPFEEKLYLCGYPGSLVWIYDPKQPWTAGRTGDGPPPTDATALNNKSGAADATTNPAHVATLKEFNEVHMPWASAIGGDGRIYFGGKVVRIGNGGGLGWWDVRKQEAGGFHEPFDRDTIFWMCAADEGRFIVCSTKPVAGRDDPNSAPPRGHLFVYDTTKHEIVHTVDDERLEAFPGFIAEGTPGTVIGYAPLKSEAGGGLLYGFDPAAGKVTWMKPVLHPPQTQFSFIRRGKYLFERGPDGMIWTFMGPALVRIDPRTAEVTPVGKAEQNPLAFVDGDVYVAGAEKFRKFVGIPKVKTVK